MDQFIEVLEHEFGMNEVELIEEFGFDSVQPGVCTNCYSVSDSCEPDQDAGYCEGCSSNSVKSLCVLLGVI